VWPRLVIPSLCKWAARCGKLTPVDRGRLPPVQARLRRLRSAMRILSPLRGWGGEVRSSGVGLVSGFREDAWFGRRARFGRCVLGMLATDGSGMLAFKGSCNPAGARGLRHSSRPAPPLAMEPLALRELRDAALRRAQELGVEEAAHGATRQQRPRGAADDEAARRDHSRRRVPVDAEALSHGAPQRRDALEVQCGEAPHHLRGEALHHRRAQYFCNLRPPPLLR
jgi:hypothetical protein